MLALGQSLVRLPRRQAACPCCSNSYECAFSSQKHCVCKLCFWLLEGPIIVVAAARACDLATLQVSIAAPAARALRGAGHTHAAAPVQTCKPVLPYQHLTNYFTLTSCLARSRLLGRGSVLLVILPILVICSLPLLLPLLPRGSAGICVVLGLLGLGAGGLARPCPVGGDVGLLVCGTRGQGVQHPAAGTVCSHGCHRGPCWCMVFFGLEQHCRGGRLLRGHKACLPAGRWTSSTTCRLRLPCMACRPPGEAHFQAVGPEQGGQQGGGLLGGAPLGGSHLQQLLSCGRKRAACLHMRAWS